MSKLKTICLVFCACLFLQGCSVRGITSVELDEGQKSVGYGSMNTIRMEDKNSDTVAYIGIPLFVESGNKIEGVIAVENKNAQAFEISHEKIKAKSQIKDSNGNITEDDIHIYSKQELLDSEKTRQNIDKFFLALAMLGNINNASRVGYHTNTGSFYGSYDGKYDYGTFSGIYQYTTFNAYENALAQENARRINEALTQNHLNTARHKLNYINTFIIDSKFISPGTGYAAKFVMDNVKINENPTKIIFNISTGEHIHKATFSVVRHD